MHDHDRLTDRFEENRPHRRTVANHVLGSLYGTNDAGQQGWKWLRRADTSGVEHLSGSLTTVVDE